MDEMYYEIKNRGGCFHMGNPNPMSQNKCDKCGQIITVSTDYNVLKEKAAQYDTLVFEHYSFVQLLEKAKKYDEMRKQFGSNVLEYEEKARKLDKIKELVSG